MRRWCFVTKRWKKDGLKQEEDNVSASVPHQALLTEAIASSVRAREETSELLHHTSVCPHRHKQYLTRTELHKRKKFNHVAIPSPVTSHAKLTAPSLAKLKNYSASLECGFVDWESQISSRSKSQTAHTEVPNQAAFWWSKRDKSSSRDVQRIWCVRFETIMGDPNEYAKLWVSNPGRKESTTVTPGSEFPAACSRLQGFCNIPQARHV